MQEPCITANIFYSKGTAFGIALRNAGFGVQFGLTADDYEGPVLNELPDPVSDGDDTAAPVTDELPKRNRKLNRNSQRNKTPIGVTAALSDYEVQRQNSR